MFVHVPSRRRARSPWGTYFLLLLAVAVFAAMLWLGSDGAERWVLKFGVSTAMWSQVVHGDRSLIPADLLQLFSALFVHANGVHLIGNLAFLLVFGLSAERPMGGRRLLTLFLLCGAAANLMGALVFPKSAHIIGSSGGVSALVGAFAVLFPGARLSLLLPLGLFIESVRMPAYSLIGLWLLVQVLMLVVAGAAAVAWPVHLFGFAFGAAFALTARSGIARRMRN